MATEKRLRMRQAQAYEALAGQVAELSESVASMSKQLVTLAKKIDALTKAATPDK